MEFHPEIIGGNFDKYLDIISIIHCFLPTGPNTIVYCFELGTAYTISELNQIINN